MEINPMRLFILSTPGRRIAEKRNEKGWTQGDLADKVGTTQQNIFYIEKKSPSSSKYYMPICEALGVTYNWVMKGEKKLSDSESAADPEYYIGIGEEALEQALTSYKSISLSKGLDPSLDEDLLKRAFTISLRGKLTGDYVTASLSASELKRKA